MRRHYHFRAFVYAGFKRHELARFQFFVGRVDFRQPRVAVRIGIAMTREMLERGYRVRAFESVHKRFSHQGDGLRVVGKRPHADNRV